MMKRVSRSRRARWPVAAAAIAVGVVGCSRAQPKPADPPSASPAVVDVVQVVSRPLHLSMAMPGELEPYDSVDIHAKVTGFVRTVRVDRGSHVRAQQLLAVLEAPELVAQRAEAQSRVQAAEAQLTTARSKSEADASTFEKLKAASATPGAVAGNDVVLAQKAVEADEGQVAAARQNVAAAQQTLQAVRDMEDYLSLRAPFEGIVTERNVSPGALVGPSAAGSAPLFRLVQVSRLRLVIPVPESYVAVVREGVPVSFSAPSHPGRKFTATVARVAHAVDVKTRTMAVELDVPNGNGELAPGLYCQVEWPVQRPGPSLLVPSGSVASTTDRVFVVRVSQNRAEWVDVKTGLASGPLVEVFGDLRAGDLVAAHATDEIRGGTAVRPRETAAPH